MKNRILFESRYLRSGRFKQHLKYLLPVNVKVSVTIDDVRFNSNLEVNQNLFFTEKSFFIQF